MSIERYIDDLRTPATGIALSRLYSEWDRTMIPTGILIKDSILIFNGKPFAEVTDVSTLEQKDVGVIVSSASSHDGLVRSGKVNQSDYMPSEAEIQRTHYLRYLNQSVRYIYLVGTGRLSGYVIYEPIPDRALRLEKWIQMLTSDHAYLIVSLTLRLNRLSKLEPRVLDLSSIYVVPTEVKSESGFSTFGYIPYIDTATAPPSSDLRSVGEIIVSLSRGEAIQVVVDDYIKQNPSLDSELYRQSMPLLWLSDVMRGDPPLGSPSDIYAFLIGEDQRLDSLVRNHDLFIQSVQEIKSILPVESLPPELQDLVNSVLFYIGWGYTNNLTWRKRFRSLSPSSRKVIRSFQVHGNIPSIPTQAEARMIISRNPIPLSISTPTAIISDLEIVYSDQTPPESKSNPGSESGSPLEPLSFLGSESPSLPGSPVSSDSFDPYEENVYSPVPIPHSGSASDSAHYNRNGVTFYGYRDTDLGRLYTTSIGSGLLIDLGLPSTIEVPLTRLSSFSRDTTTIELDHVQYIIYTNTITVVSRQSFTDLLLLTLDR